VLTHTPSYFLLMLLPRLLAVAEPYPYHELPCNRLIYTATRALLLVKLGCEFPLLCFTPYTCYLSCQWVSWLLLCSCVVALSLQKQ
jgi:hypothetical protein